MPADDHLAVEGEPPRRGIAGARGVGGAHRETVDIGAIERRHVDRRGQVAREHAAERIGERDCLTGQRRQIDMPRKTRARLLGRDHFEELLLPRGAADGGDKVVLGGFRLETRSHGQGLIMTSVPGGYPSLAAGTRIQPSACASAESGT